MSRNRSDNSVYKKIREQICLLKYPPGELVSENTLAAEFGLSRSPIRRVLQRLELDGLVVTRQGVGTLVTTTDIKSLKEVYALRIKLAELIGDLSSSPAPNADFAELDQLLERCQGLKTQPDYEELVLVNMRFNDFLTHCISNKPLREISSRLYYQTARVWPQILPDMDWTEEIEAMLTEIEQIGQALQQGDMDRVGQLRRDHIVQSLSRIQRYLGDGSF